MEPGQARLERKNEIGKLGNFVLATIKDKKLFFFVFYSNGDFPWEGVLYSSKENLIGSTISKIQIQLLARDRQTHIMLLLCEYHLIDYFNLFFHFQIGKGKVAEIKLEELGSNKLFASCPIETYPGPAVQQVVDSSR